MPAFTGYKWQVKVKKRDRDVRDGREMVARWSRDGRDWRP